MSIQETLRAKFFEQFVVTARERTATCQTAVSKDQAQEAANELHSLAGESSMLGYDEIAALARNGEALAKEWVAGEKSKRLKCGRVIRDISKAVDAISSHAGTLSPSTDAPAPATSSILIIDDSELVLDQLQEGLEAKSLEVHTSTDFDQAIGQAQDRAPALILMDANIPGVESAALVARLRSASPSSRLIIFSGLSNTELETMSRSLGVDGFVSKQDGLESVISGVLRTMSELSA